MRTTANFGRRSCPRCARLLAIGGVGRRSRSGGSSPRDGEAVIEVLSGTCAPAHLLAQACGSSGDDAHVDGHWLLFPDAAGTSRLSSSAQAASLLSDPLRSAPISSRNNRAALAALTRRARGHRAREGPPPPPALVAEHLALRSCAQSRRSRRTRRACRGRGCHCGSPRRRSPARARLASSKIARRCRTPCRHVDHHLHGADGPTQCAEALALALGRPSRRTGGGVCVDRSFPLTCCERSPHALRARFPRVRHRTVPQFP